MNQAKKLNKLFFTAFSHEEVSNAMRPEAFPLFLSVAILAAFLLSKSGASPKSESRVGLTQFMNTFFIKPFEYLKCCFFRQRMCERSVFLEKNSISRADGEFDISFSPFA